MIAELTQLEEVLCGIPLPKSTGAAKVISEGCGAFDAELSRPLAKIGLAILAGKNIPKIETMALARLASSKSPRVCAVAKCILVAMDKVREPLANTEALVILDKIARREVAHAG